MEALMPEVAREADRVLARTDELVARERLARGAYMILGEPEPEAPCGGHAFCLVGSLLWSAGLRPDEQAVEEANPDGGGLGLVVTWLEASEAGRHRVLWASPPLAAAYEALNEVAGEWLDAAVDQGEEDEPFAENLRASWNSVAEGLLEDGGLDDDDARRLVALARERVARSVGARA